MRGWLKKPLVLATGVGLADRDLSLQDISYGKAFTIGLIQSLSMVPGVSRSGAAGYWSAWRGGPPQTFIPFGVYRIVVGVLFLLFIT